MVDRIFEEILFENTKELEFGGVLFGLEVDALTELANKVLPRIFEEEMTMHDGHRVSVNAGVTLKVEPLFEGHLLLSSNKEVV